MRIYLTLPALAFAALIGFSAGEARAGRFFGSASYGADSAYQYPSRSRNSFDYGPGPNCQGRHSRHRWFHRDQGVANGGMPINTMPGYGMQPAYGMPLEYMQSPIVQSPAPTPPIHMTSGVPGAPVMQAPSCQKCGQAAQVQAAPAVQSRIVPVPAPMPQGPTTAEPPPADPAPNSPF